MMFTQQELRPWGSQELWGKPSSPLLSGIQLFTALNLAVRELVEDIMQQYPHSVSLKNKMLRDGENRCEITVFTKPPALPMLEGLPINTCGQ